MYINKSADIVNDCNNTYQRTIKITSVDVNSSTYFDFNVENDNKDPKFEVAEFMRTLKYKNIFAKRLHFNLV